MCRVSGGAEVFYHSILGQGAPFPQYGDLEAYQPPEVEVKLPQS